MVFHDYLTYNALWLAKKAKSVNKAMVSDCAKDGQKKNRYGAVRRGDGSVNDNNNAKPCYCQVVADLSRKSNQNYGR